MYPDTRTGNTLVQHFPLLHVTRRPGGSHFQRWFRCCVRNAGGGPWRHDVRDEEHERIQHSTTIHERKERLSSLRLGMRVALPARTGYPGRLGCINRYRTSVDSRRSRYLSMGIGQGSDRRCGLGTVRLRTCPQRISFAKVLGGGTIFGYSRGPPAPVFPDPTGSSLTRFSAGSPRPDRLQGGVRRHQGVVPLATCTNSAC